MKYLIIISIIIYWTKIILLETATADTTFVQYVASIYLVLMKISATKAPFLYYNQLTTSSSTHIPIIPNPSPHLQHCFYNNFPIFLKSAVFVIITILL